MESLQNLELDNSQILNFTLNPESHLQISPEEPSNTNNLKLLDSRIFTIKLDLPSKPVHKKRRKPNRQLNEKLQLVQNLFINSLAYTKQNEFPPGFSDEVEYVQRLLTNLSFSFKEDIMLILRLLIDRKDASSLMNDYLAKMNKFSFKNFPSPFLPLAESRFLKEISNLTCRQIRSFNKIHTKSSYYQELLLAFLCLLAEIDGTLKFLEALDPITPKVIGFIKVYFANPGHIIQRIRSFPDYVRSYKIRESALKYAQDWIPDQIPAELETVKTVMDEACRLFYLYKPLLEQTGHPNISSFAKEGEITYRPLPSRPMTLSSTGKSNLLQKFAKMSPKHIRRGSENQENEIHAPFHRRGKSTS